MEATQKTVQLFLDKQRPKSAFHIQSMFESESRGFWHKLWRRLRARYTRIMSGTREASHLEAKKLWRVSSNPKILFTFCHHLPLNLDRHALIID